MTRLDDESQAACAWGRWRIGPALNETIPARSERRTRNPERPRLAARRARLRLVADRGRTPATPR